MKPVAGVLIGFAWVCACEKPQGEPPKPIAAGMGLDAGAVAVSTDGEALVPPARGPMSWQGTYESTPGTLYIPPDWKGVRFVTSDPGGGLGAGEIAVQIDPASGRVRGTLAGPLGPATLDGVVSGGKLAATIRRQDASDHGFTGTLFGTMADDHAEGTMNLSLPEAAAIRSVTFTISAHR